MSSTGAPDQNAPPPPPSPPRTVPRWALSSTSRMLKWLGIVIAVLIVAGLGILHVTVGSSFEDDVLDQRGKVVSVTPTGTRVVATTSGQQIQIHAIDFVFEDEQGRRHRGSVTQTHQDQLEAAERRETLEVEVDAQDPRVARWPGQRLSPFGSELYYVGGVFAVGGVALALLGVALGFRDRHLYARGQARLGRLSRVETFVENRQTGYRIDYSYEADGTRLDGHWVARGIAEPAVGAIWVIVDDGNPYRSVPVLEG